MSENRASLEIPEPFIELFQPSKNWRHIIYYGGRSSGKSTQVGLSLLIEAASKTMRILCVREVQKSIEKSVHKLLSDLIRRHDFLKQSWVVTKESIRNKVTGSEFMFEGMYNNEDNNRSYEGVDVCWVEEAESVSASSIDVLIPTIRKEGSRIIWTFNRLTEHDPVWDRLVVNPSDRTYIRKVNSEEIEDLLSDEVKFERAEMLKNNPEMFSHVWLGEPLTSKTGSVFGKQLSQATIENRICSVPYDASAGVYTAWDLGIGDSTAIWFFQRIMKESRFIDYYENSGEDLAHYIATIRQKGYNYAAHFLPHDAKQRELQTGLSRVEFFAQNDIRNVEVLRPTNFQIGNDDINLIARPKLSRCWFDAEKCARGLECLRAYHYEFDEKNNLLKSKPEHDWSSHASSAFIYALIAESQAEARANTPIIKVIKPKNSSINNILY